MERLNCDKPYNIDEMRKNKGLPKRKRKDPKTIAYELTIRIPKNYQPIIGKTKFTKTVFVLNKSTLRDEQRDFEAEKNDELIRMLEHEGFYVSGENVDKIHKSRMSIGNYAKRYIEIRSNGSVGIQTLRNEKNYLKYINASIGQIPLSKLTSDDVEQCLLDIPKYSEAFARERQRKRLLKHDENFEAINHRKPEPLAPVKVAGADMQSKVLKFIREVLNYAVEKGDLSKNVAKAKFLSRVFKRASRLLIL